MHRRFVSTVDASASLGGGSPTSRKRRRRGILSQMQYFLSKRRSLGCNALTVGVVIVICCLSGMVALPRVREYLHEHINGDKNKKKSHKITVKDLPILPWNDIYRIPKSMDRVGDRSNYYVSLRKEIDPLVVSQLPDLLSKLRAQQKYTYVSRPMEMTNSDQISYDIYNCPDTPPPGYPYTWDTMDVISAWPADDTEPPLDENGNALVHQSLCVFDFEQDLDKALRYRDAHLPYVVVNDPAVLKTAARWSMPNYLQRMLNDGRFHVEYSQNNHFMYFAKKGKKIPEGWKPPTSARAMTYQEWLQKAQTPRHGRDDPHWYFRLIGCGLMGDDKVCQKAPAEFLYDELPFFQPRKGLYIYDPDAQRGIHCRAGMPGVIAENHYDAQRNNIALFSGSRRYILSNPEECSNMCLYDMKHPSARHSAIDWSNPDTDKYPQFKQARSNEVVLLPGHVLFLPTSWFHYIVSLEINMQCNTRSGNEKLMRDKVKHCKYVED